MPVDTALKSDTEPIRYVTLHFRDRRGLFRSVPEIAPKSPSLWANRIPIRNGFRAGAKTMRYGVNISVSQKDITLKVKRQLLPFH